MKIQKQIQTILDKGIDQQKQLEHKSKIMSIREAMALKKKQEDDKHNPILQQIKKIHDQRNPPVIPKINLGKLTLYQDKVADSFRKEEK